MMIIMTYLWLQTEYNDTVKGVAKNNRKCKQYHLTPISVQRARKLNRGADKGFRELNICQECVIVNWIKKEPNISGPPTPPPWLGKQIYLTQPCFRDSIKVWWWRWSREEAMRGIQRNNETFDILKIIYFCILICIDPIKFILKYTCTCNSQCAN